MHRVRQGHKFCTKEFSKTAGPRACDNAHPCREDYICTEGYDDLPEAKPGEGTCIPPYLPSAQLEARCQRVKQTEGGRPGRN
ncbi:hypothetical protein X739_03745 [Mesorhizobium sp. LNHC220B00]|nr:hypothetical protein X739_03745 [Mesorhizobium sp. LNHC220B00]